MEKTTLEALGWQLKSSDNVRPIPAGDDAASAVVAHKASLNIRRRFQFSSALKRMSTVSALQHGKTLACVKGAPETIKAMLCTVPSWYDETFKWYTRRGSRVLALAFKEMHGLNFDKVQLPDDSPLSKSAHIHMQINHLRRDQVESDLTFAGFLVFHCPLKQDAVETLKMLADSSHRCIMITGDNPLTAVHVAKEVEIVDRDTLILDLRENPSHPGGRFESLRYIEVSGLTNHQTLSGRLSTTLGLSQ